MSIKYDENKSLKQNIKVLFDWLNWNTREMSDGRVKYQGEQITGLTADNIQAEVRITELDLQHIQSEQALTDLDLRLLEIESKEN